MRALALVVACAACAPAPRAAVLKSPKANVQAAPQVRLAEVPVHPQLHEEWPSRPEVVPETFALQDLPRARIPRRMRDETAPDRSSERKTTLVDAEDREQAAPAIARFSVRASGGGARATWDGWESQDIRGHYSEELARCGHERALVSGRWESIDRSARDDEVNYTIGDGWFDPIACTGWVERKTILHARRLVRDGSLFALRDLGPDGTDDAILFLMPPTLAALAAHSFVWDKPFGHVRVTRGEEGVALVALIPASALAEWQHGPSQPPPSPSSGERYFIVGAEISPDRSGVAYSTPWLAR